MSEITDIASPKVPQGAKTLHGTPRPEYRDNPDPSRDPPSDGELEAMRGRRGAKLWRKARRGKL